MSTHRNRRLRCMTKDCERRQKRESKPSWFRNQKARARAIARRVLELAARRAVEPDTKHMAESLRHCMNDPYSKAYWLPSFPVAGLVDGTIRRRSTRTRIMLPHVAGITDSWRHRVQRCGQCGESEPENPCGGPCNAVLFGAQP